MTKKPYIFLLFALVVLSNCSNLKNEMFYMTDLKKNISETFDIENIDIKIINKNTLEISLNDSRFNDFNHQKKEKIAKQIGELSKKLREHLPELKTGILVCSDNLNFGVLKTSKSEYFKMF